MPHLPLLRGLPCMPVRQRFPLIPRSLVGGIAGPIAPAPLAALAALQRLQRQPATSCSRVLLSTISWRPACAGSCCRPMAAAKCAGAAGGAACLQLRTAAALLRRLLWRLLRRLLIGRSMGFRDGPWCVREVLKPIWPVKLVVMAQRAVHDNGCWPLQSPATNAACAAQEPFRSNRKAEVW